jgi:hypothetical protein
MGGLPLSDLDRARMSTGVPFVGMAISGSS